MATATLPRARTTVVAGACRCIPTDDPTVLLAVALVVEEGVALDRLVGEGDLVGEEEGDGRF